jgi:hypothetical protein
MNVRRLIFIAIAIPALAAGMAAFRADAQAPASASLDVRPYGTSRTDPDGGQWFVANMDPGQTKTFQMRLFNTTSAPKTAKLYMADMLFNPTGTPYVAGTSTDVGAWGRFGQSHVTVPPRSGILVSFTVTVPAKADPGDHIGAVVVEEPPSGAGNLRSVARTALRLYVTLPGDARKDFQIKSVKAARHSVFYPRQMTVTVQLRNTGRVRLNPSVSVDGAPATGPGLLVSQSIESYTTTRPIRFWGGPMRLHISAVTTSLGLPGPSRQTSVIVWVIPWFLIFALAVLAALVLGVRYLLRKRATKVEALKSDLRRIERLITQQQMTPPGSGISTAPDPRTAIQAALKQAKRSGDKQTAERLAAMQSHAREKAPATSTDQDAARMAILDAARQARRAGDRETAKRLETYLAETARQINAGEQSPPSASGQSG